MRRLAVIWFRHRGRPFIILENSCNFAEKALLFLGFLRIVRVLTIGGIGLRRGRGHRLVSPAEELGKKAFHPRLLVAGIVRLGSGYKRGNVVVCTVWSGQ